MTDMDPAERPKLHITDLNIDDQAMLLFAGCDRKNIGVLEEQFRLIVHQAQEKGRQAGLEQAQNVATRSCGCFDDIQALKDKPEGGQ